MCALIFYYGSEQRKATAPLRVQRGPRANKLANHVLDVLPPELDVHAHAPRAA